MRVWMLVVLVLLIFGVAACLFPIFTRCREIGKAPAISNIKQITLAAIMYAQEYDQGPGKPPRARPPGSSSSRSLESSRRAGVNH